MSAKDGSIKLVAGNSNPRLAEAHNNLGVALYRLGEKTEAFTHFEEANRLDPDFGRFKPGLVRAAVDPDLRVETRLNRTESPA